MDIKKNPKIGLNKKRSLFLAAGYVVAVSVTLAAFEYKTFYEGPIIPEDTISVRDLNVDDDIVITYRKKEFVKPDSPKKLPTPTISARPAIAQFVEVPNETPIEEPTELTFDPPAEPMPEPPVEVYVDPNETFIGVEEMPKFPGNDQGLLTFLAENVKYPRIAIENNITGIVYVEYVVDQHGDVVDVKLKNRVDPFLDREALRVVRSITTGYSAGKQRGIPVRVQFTVPIRFVLKN